MIPKVGEPILIGRQNETERPATPMFGEEFGTMVKSGGDRSYIDCIWLCVAVENDRCVVFKLMPKGEKPSWINFGATEPRMILFDEYPISKCSGETLKYFTGYELSDNLIEAVTKQKQNANT